MTKSLKKLLGGIIIAVIGALVTAIAAEVIQASKSPGDSDSVKISNQGFNQSYAPSTQINVNIANGGEQNKTADPISTGSEPGRPDENPASPPKTPQRKSENSKLPPDFDGEGKYEERKSTNVVKSVEREKDTLKIAVNDGSRDSFLGGKVIRREDSANFTVVMPRNSRITVPGSVSKIITHRDNLAGSASEGRPYGNGNDRYFTSGQTIDFSGARDSKVEVILKP